MLTNLVIKNVVLIEALSIDFESGFSALTGETGAGKSILLDSLGLALGARSDAGLVRKGEDKAQVTATFEIIDKTHALYTLLEEADIAIDHGEALVLRRQIGADGRSKAFINDQPVSVGLLRQIGDTLIEIHGQFDTHGLLDAKTHRAMLDEYAGIDARGLKDTWQEWHAAEKALTAARSAIEQAREDEDYLRQAIEDLDGLSPEAGEEEKLVSLRDRLMKRDQVIEGLNNADQGLSEAENVIGTIWRALERIEGEVAPLMEALDRANAELQEAGVQLRNIHSDFEENEYSLEEIDDRLYALRGQARKHQCAVDDLAQMREDLAVQLNNIEQQDGILADLMKDVERKKDVFTKVAQSVSDARGKAAAKLDGLVAKELPPLKLEKAKFVTDIAALPEAEWGAHGMDRVQFLVSTNPGREAGALNKIASGGELARFMLALKVVLAEIGMAGSLIFDEVDTGIGGSTAAAVGDRLARLAASKQILVVTHSPQVAARAGQHFIVMKSGTREMKTDIVCLQELDMRREEVARMLAGSEITAEARAAADKLLESA
jgi:DNA repair protein RecN (Recombination protein N)